MTKEQELVYLRQAHQDFKDAISDRDLKTSIQLLQTFKNYNVHNFNSHLYQKYESEVNELREFVNQRNQERKSKMVELIERIKAQAMKPRVSKVIANDYDYQNWVDNELSFDHNTENYVTE